LFRRILLAALIGGVPAESAAQSPLMPTISGGIVFELPPRSVASFGVEETALVRGVTFGTGVYKARLFELDGEGAWHTGATIARVVNLGSVVSRKTTSRDIPVVLTVRWTDGCTARSCFILTAGGGMNFWYRSMLDTLVDQRTIRSIESRAEPTITFGVEAFFRMSQAVELRPALRAWQVFRWRDPGKGRAAVEGNLLIPPSLRLEVGVGVAWHLRKH
jgi:hypothetical protein